MDNTGQTAESSAGSSSSTYVEGQRKKKKKRDNKKDSLSGKVKKLAERLKAFKRKHDRGPDGDGNNGAAGSQSAPTA